MVVVVVVVVVLVVLVVVDMVAPKPTSNMVWIWADSCVWFPPQLVVGHGSVSMPPVWWAIPWDIPGQRGKATTANGTLVASLHPQACKPCMAAEHI